MNTSPPVSLMEAGMAELKPCPFCGKRAHIEDGRNERPWVVQCHNRDCPAQPYIDHADTRDQAIADWNTRTPDPRITRLEADRVELIRIINEAMIWDGADSEGVDAVWLSDARETLARIKEK